MTSNKSKERKSLCEESMLVFVNILKLSSLSIARRTLVKTSNHDHPSPSKLNRKTVEPTSPNPSPPKRSQKPNQSQSSKYMILPNKDITYTSPCYCVLKEEIANVDGEFSDYIKRFHEKTENDDENAIVECKAESFIKRFHEKNISDLNNESRRSNYVLPPPPRHVFK